MLSLHTSSLSVLRHAVKPRSVVIQNEAQILHYNRPMKYSGKFCVNDECQGRNDCLNALHLDQWMSCGRINCPPHWSVNSAAPFHKCDTAYHHTTITLAPIHLHLPQCATTLMSPINHTLCVTQMQLDVTC